MGVGLRKSEDLQGKRLLRHVRNHDGLHHFVGQRLPLRIPQRQEPTDVEDEAVDEMSELAEYASPAADHITRLLADDLDTNDSLARALPTGSGHVREVEARRGGAEVQDQANEEPKGSDDSADDRGDDDADDQDPERRPPVDEARRGTRAPGGEL